MPEHTVQQGECLSSIGRKYGLFWRTIWEHPNNARLKNQRKDPNVLKPGDVLFVPDRQEKEAAAATESRHRFLVKGTPAEFRLRLLREGEPRAGIAYVLEIEGQQFLGRTDNDGLIQHFIDPRATEGRLILRDGQEIYPLQLGHLDPLDNVTGVQQRLINLGFYGGPVDGRMTPDTQAALRAFQQDRGLDASGELDRPTQDALKDYHQS